MTERDDLDQLLTTWLTSDAAASEPEHLLGQVLTKTARTRRRPAWRVPERWVPVSAISNAAMVPARLSWRTIGVAVLLILALIASLLIVAGSQPRLPPPFGVAGNGNVAYGRGGDILVRDPISRETNIVVGGPTIDGDPGFSMDGTRLAFLRRVDSSDTDLDIPSRMDHAELWVASADGSAQHRIGGPFARPLRYEWSPVGDAIAIESEIDGLSAVTIVEVETGRSTRLGSELSAVERISWRPPDGRQVWFYGFDGTDGGLYAFDRVKGVTNKVDGVEPGLTIDEGWLAWSPDGTRVAVAKAPSSTSGDQIHILAIGPGGEAQSDRTLPVELGGWIISPRFLPQGDRILFWRSRGASGDPEGTVDDIWTLNVASADDGMLLASDLRCCWDPSGSGRFVVAPDGRSLLVFDGPQLVRWLDLETGGGNDAGFTTDDTVTWQRIAP